jgi:anaerobic magnesium-protoporphyrin IX monomethyl ester cyclase
VDMLLIDPPRVYWGFGGGLGYYSPPVGLVTLAGFLEAQGVAVDILDCNATGVGWDELADEIRRRKPRCVGVSSSMTCYVPEAFRCAEVAKAVDPQIHTVGGGLQFTLAAEEALRKCPSLDSIVRGDGEFTTLELLRELQSEEPHLDRITGLSFRRGETIAHNEPRRAIEDLDSLPLPAWHLLPMREYRLPVVPPRWGSYTIVVTARGCPFQCTFCSPRQGQSPYRALSAKRVLEMMENLYQEHGIRVFWFSDLSFNVNSQRTEEILDGIIERGWKVRIAFDGTRTDLLLRDARLLPKMKKAGVFIIFLGVESYTEDDLEYYRKGTNLLKAEQAVALIKRHGIHTWCFFMVGHPRHDRTAVLNMLEYAKKLDPTIAIFSLVTPIPGTAFHEEMSALGLIEEEDWAKYDLAHPVMRTEHLSRKELLDLLDFCFTGYYNRARKILRHGILGDEFARYTYGFLRFVQAARQIKEGNL